MRISLTIPDTLYGQIKGVYEDAGFNTLNDYILDCIRNKHQSGADSDKAAEKETPTLPKISAKELNVKCGSPFCKAKAVGRYKVSVQDDTEGVITTESFMCPFHLLQAKKEGEVTDVE
jgi:hypothetical protein